MSGMPLSSSLLRWVRSLFAGRSRGVKSVVVVVLVLFGWALLFFSFMATAIADAVGAIGPGRRMPPAIRIGVGVLALIIVGAISMPPRRDIARVTEVPTPTPTTVAITTPTASIPTPTTPAVPTPTTPAVPTPTPVLAPTPTPVLAPTPTPEPTGTPAPTSITVTDPRNDQFDEDDNPVDGVPYQDIVAMSASWLRLDFQLQLVLEVAAAPPKVDPLREVITFAWLLDSTMDGHPDWLIIVENLDEPRYENVPGWSVGLMRMEDGQSLDGPEFPGTLLVDGARVTVTTDLYNRTDRVGIAAMTEHTIWKGPLEATTIHDDLPENQYPDGNEWFVIATQ